ncbi:GNAT family N-acetyltransferase [Desulfovibrio ferrophilus]|uniref:Putative acetyltransferase family protein n=1 Tax=Desulfovibrio ferrophilus TaxID=241368 RepID=A0A2Z6B1L7_9BACT|nr:GNAT family N-acetyltransferase [Desulfovibrio ferrophilus]BBD09353.1 putative acetyltransferase family protein [Desulfovibrio ferrophilus]
MNLTNLSTMFKPNSVAVIGATEEQGHPGAVIMKNLLASKFIGPIIPVHDTLSQVYGLPVYREIDTLPLTPDLAIICSAPETVPDYVLQLGRRGVSGAVILGNGFEDLPPDVCTMLENAILGAARQTDLRFLGPDSIGFLSPSVGINASLGHTDITSGRVAFITESDSLFTTVLDWAKNRGIGFSHFISLGKKLDFGFGELLDFLNSDPGTRAVLLYVEEIRNARAFLSAARATARNKPLLVIKAGRTPEASRLIARYRGGQQGWDAVYEAAFRRSGMLRVPDIDSLFDSVETIVRTKPMKGERLAILANGKSPGILVQDMIIEGGGKMAVLEEETRTQLLELLEVESGGPAKHFLDAENPVNITAHAPPERYAEALKILLKAKGVDAVLVLRVPSPLVDGQEVAHAVAKASRRAKRPVLTSWMGGDNAQQARDILSEAGISTYWTPDKAVRAFLNLVNYRRNQEMLMETPASLPSEFMPDTATARMVVESALENGHELLSVPEAMDVLDSYDIPVVETRLSGNAEAAVTAAEEMGYPVALKVLSPDNFCKSLAGGVVLDLETADAVAEAAQAVVDRVTTAHPDCRVAGYVVQRMGRRPRARELFIKAGMDPVFGPYIHFGQGGAETDIIGDHAVSLPPLNMSLAKELISRTAISRLLRGGKGSPPADINILCLTLVKVSQLIVDIPEIQSLEINPLFADGQGLLALDAEIRVAPYKGDPGARLAIRPYPRELEESVVLKDDRKVILRPIRPEDEPAHWEFLSKLSVDDIRYRFFGLIRELPRSEMIRLTQIDYDREMAFIATAETSEGSGEYETLGVVRGMTKPDNSDIEFAIVVRSDYKRRGLGGILMRKLISYAKTRKTKYMIGEALLENKGMSVLSEKLGFEVKKNYDDDLYKFKLLLHPE